MADHTLWTTGTIVEPWGTREISLSFDDEDGYLIHQLLTFPPHASLTSMSINKDELESLANEILFGKDKIV